MKRKCLTKQSVDFASSMVDEVIDLIGGEYPWISEEENAALTAHSHAEDELEDHLLDCKEGYPLSDRTIDTLIEDAKMYRDHYHEAGEPMEWRKAQQLIKELEEMRE